MPAGHPTAEQPWDFAIGDPDTQLQCHAVPFVDRSRRSELAQLADDDLGELLLGSNHGFVMPVGLARFDTSETAMSSESASQLSQNWAELVLGRCPIAEAKTFLVAGDSAVPAELGYARAKGLVQLLHSASTGAELSDVRPLDDVTPGDCVAGHVLVPAADMHHVITVELGECSPEHFLRWRPHRVSAYALCKMPDHSSAHR